MARITWDDILRYKPNTNNTNNTIDLGNIANPYKALKKQDLYNPQGYEEYLKTLIPEEPDYSAETASALGIQYRDQLVQQRNEREAQKNAYQQLLDETKPASYDTAHIGQVKNIVDSARGYHDKNKN